jgi:hypothetical protein
VAMWSVGGCRQLRFPQCWFQLRSMDSKFAPNRSADKQYAFLRIKPTFWAFSGLETGPSGPPVSPSRSCGRLAAGFADNKDRELGVMDHRIRHAAQEETLPGREAPGAHDEQIERVLVEVVQDLL